MMLYGTEFEAEDSAFQPDTVGGEGYFLSLHRREFVEPEKKLMLAILDDALKCLMTQVHAKARRRQKLFRSAEEWLLSDTEDWIFSFRNVCEAVGISPSHLRKCVLTWKKEQLAIQVKRGGFGAGPPNGGVMAGNKV
jgi:hypothetical protein